MGECVGRLNTYSSVSENTVTSIPLRVHLRDKPETGTGKGKQMIDSTHDDEFGMDGTRACFEHDKSEHWRDDYTFAIGEPAHAAPNTYSDMVELLKRDQPEDNPNVYRFATVYVRADTGTVELVGSPDQNHDQLVNLLSKAISLVAFQQDHAKGMVKAQMSEMLGEFLGDLDDDTVTTPPNEGLYL